VVVPALPYEGAHPSEGLAEKHLAARVEGNAGNERIEGMMFGTPAQQTPLYDVHCPDCSLHRVTMTMPQTCSKCSSVNISVLPAKGTIQTR
jgi:ribosomal protein S27E